MRMKKLFILLLISALLLALTGCSGGDCLVLAEDGKTAYSIVNYLSDDEAARSFSTKMIAKTKATIPVVSDPGDGKSVIYVGMPETLAEAAGVSGETFLGSYQIKANGDCLYVIVSDESVAMDAIAMLRDAVEKISDGKFGLKKDTDLVGSICGTQELAPAFTTAQGTASRIHNCGGGFYEYVYSEMDPAASPAEIAAYEKSLTAAGFTLYSEKNIDANRHFTYTKGETMVHGNYFPNMKEFRVVFGAKGYLPDTAPIECEKVVTPSFTNIGVSANTMGMIFQASDGSFVVIDGGYDTAAPYDKVLNSGEKNERVVPITPDVDADMEAFMTFMKENTPGGGKPQVTWMITHADPDHILMPPLFFEKYKDEFDLNTICYNFPDYNEIGLSNGNPDKFAGYAENFIKTAKDCFPNVNSYIYHTGEQLQLPGNAYIEFLFTHEDYWPSEMPWMNHTSGIWRICAEGKTILILGDAESGPNSRVAREYGSYMKSDILQPSHHGANGGALVLYKLVDPTVCFWSCQQYHLDYDNRQMGVKTGYEFNQFLRQSPNVIADYSCSETATVLLPSLEKK